MDRYANRRQAGQKLATLLSEYEGRDDVVVMGLPRGGVPVAYEVAKKLGAPLDVFTVRKLGTPGQPELAMGAIASGGIRVLNDRVVRALNVSKEAIEREASREQQELERREREYRAGRQRLDVRGKTAILVDDGLATGSSMMAAVRALRRLEPARIVVAVPAAAPETCASFRDICDDVVCALTPTPFFAVGAWYKDFAQTSDDEVKSLLREAHDSSSSTER